MRETLCVCVCEWRKIVFDLRVMLPRTHIQTHSWKVRLAHCAYANSFNLANASIFKDHAGNSMTKAQRNAATCWQIK